MVRSERYKMAVKSNSRRPVELYDLNNDPNELNNLVKNTSYNTVRQELVERYFNMLFDRGDMNKV